MRFWPSGNHSQYISVHRDGTPLVLGNGAGPFDLLTEEEVHAALSDWPSPMLRTGPLRPDILPLGYAMAHRGGGVAWPENAKGSILGALGQGHYLMDGGDWRLTSDGQLVSMHAADVDTTTSGTGNVATMTLAQVQATYVDLVSTNAIEAGYTQQPPQTISDVLSEIVTHPDALFTPEAKVTGATAPLVAAIQAAGLTDRCIFQSFTLSDLATAKAAGMKVAWLQSGGGGTALSALNGAGFQVDYFAYDFTNGTFTPAVIQAIYDAGHGLAPWTFNRRVEVANERARVGRPLAWVAANAPMWINSTQPFSATSAPVWSLRRFPHGHLAQGASSGARGTFPGGDAWRVGSGNGAFCLMGPFISAQTFSSITFTVSWDVAFASGNAGVVMQFGMPDDAFSSFGSIPSGGYQVLLRQNGTPDECKQLVGAASTALGSKNRTGGARTPGSTVETFKVEFLGSNVKVTNQTTGDVICNASNKNYRSGLWALGVGGGSDGQLTFSNVIVA